MSYMAVAGTGVQALATIMGGIAQGKAADYAAQVAANNAIIAEQNAQRAMAAGQEQAGIASLRGAGEVAKTKTAQAAAGIDVNTGSAVGVRASEREQGQLSAETVQANAGVQAYGYRTQEMGFEAQSALEHVQAQQAPISADISAAGKMMSAVGGMPGMSPTPAAAGATATTGTGAMGDASAISTKWLTPATPSGPDLGGGVWPA